MVDKPKLVGGVVVVRQYQSRCMTIGKFNVLLKPAKALTDVCRETSVLAKGFGRNEKSTLVIKASWEA